MARRFRIRTAMVALTTIILVAKIGWEYCKYYEWVADGIWIVESIDSRPSNIEVFAVPPDGGSWPDGVAYPGYTDVFAICIDGRERREILLDSYVVDGARREVMGVKVGDRVKLLGLRDSEGNYPDVKIQKL